MSEPQQVLARWTEFPVAVDPRPVVLNGRRVLVPRASPTGNYFLATEDGAILSDVELPPGISTQAVRSQSFGKAGGMPLTVRDVREVTATFAADRGPVALPAWSLSFHEDQQPIVVLDADVEDRDTWWPSAWHGHWARETSPHRPVTVEPDGQSLTYRFMGLTPEQFTYTAEVFESDHAVFISPREHLFKGTAWHDKGYGREVQVALSRPLKNRLVLGQDGIPLTVTTT